MGQLQVPLLNVVKTAPEAAMIWHRRQLPRRRLFDDLSAKPDMCNPLTAGSPDRGEPNGEPTQAGGGRRRTTPSDDRCR